MLHLFVANSGRVLSKQELFEAIWPNVHVADDSLFQCIREIRTALGGYLFEADVLVEPVGSDKIPRKRQAFG